MTKRSRDRVSLGTSAITALEVGVSAGEGLNWSRTRDEGRVAGRLSDFPEAIGDLEAFLDDASHGSAVFELDKWMWCEQCELAFPVGNLRVVKSGPGWSYYEWALECATENCTGRRCDWHPWHPSEIPRALHTEYPEIPTAGTRYPITSKSSSL